MCGEGALELSEDRGVRSAAPPEAKMAAPPRLDRSGAGDPSGPQRIV